MVDLIFGGKLGVSLIVFVLGWMTLEERFATAKTPFGRVAAVFLCAAGVLITWGAIWL